ncbi:uncharacterized protein LOC132728707 [Ruditapes philippinarum]|uniref:uncharacterized protein LOC132728707 n=1 Tax=Ruditapes philippinarum TaxID=129788 RepID=UPI00295C18D4|nr:uncharacterized protein LOC132728707 [Ruditapes philippinarum]
MKTGNLFKILFLIIAIFSVTVFSEDTKDYEKLFIEHRLELLENGIASYVGESIPKMRSLEDQVEYLQKENTILHDIIENQNKKIKTLQWATEDMKVNQLTREERDLVTELKWTIFDLKEANRELQEDACMRKTECNEWEEWSRCSVDCGKGTRIRSRGCSNTGRFSSMCKPLDIEEQSCHGSNCRFQSTLSQFDCPDGYYSFQGLCLRFSGRQDGRLHSTILCEEESSHLVFIDSAEKHEAVVEFINIVAPEYMVDMHEDFSKREYWDFHDIDQKTHVAVDGIRKHQKTYFINWKEQNMTYFNWAVGQPRNDKSDGDYCVTINVLTGEWYMKCCTVTFFYICESEERRER